MMAEPCLGGDEPPSFKREERDREVEDLREYLREYLFI